MRLVALILVALASSGCLTAGLAIDALVGGVSIYQRYEDRGVQREQTAEIKALREAVDRNTDELRRVRERLP